MKNLKGKKSASGASGGVSNEHSYSQAQRQLRHKTVPQESSESEEIDSYSCCDCKKKIYTNEPPVECDFCNNVFCFKCSEISSKPQYKKLSSSAKEEEGMMWFCVHCRISNPGVKKMLIRVTKLEENQSSVLERLDNLEQQSEGIDDKIKGAIMEQREIDARKLNIICFGLKESTEENAVIRNADDKAKLNHIINNVLEISENEFSVGDTPVRIGRFDEAKTRPLKFAAKSFESKKKLLEVARNKLKTLNDPECKDLFFKPDLTKKQRAEAFSRRENRRKEKASKSKEERRRSNEPVGAVGGEPFHGPQRH